MEDERGGATGGGGVPFSLKEITCIDSETVSASSSLFGIQQGVRLGRLPYERHIVGDYRNQRCFHSRDETSCRWKEVTSHTYMNCTTAFER